LLGDADEKLAQVFQGGSMAVFRLAPQDYHRFHFSVSGTLLSATPVPGHLYTVNPIAVNATDIFTGVDALFCPSVLTPNALVYFSCVLRLQRWHLLSIIMLVPSLSEASCCEM